jgi:hypothetical protein
VTQTSIYEIQRPEERENFTILGNFHISSCKSGLAICSTSLNTKRDPIYWQCTEFPSYQRPLIIGDSILCSERPVLVARIEDK